MPGEATTPIFLSSSLSKDSVDSFSNLSSSCPTNVLNAKAKIGLPLTEDEMKLVIRDRQKKDNHNMSKTNQNECFVFQLKEKLCFFDSQLNDDDDLISTIELKNWECFCPKELICKSEEHSDRKFIYNFFDSLLSFFRDTKQNKGTILRASVDYIKILRRQYDNNVLIEEKCQTLNEENHALRERIRVRF